MCTYSAKDIQLTKRLQRSEEVEKYFPGFLAFIDTTEQQQIPRPVDKNKRKMYYSGKKKKKKRRTVKNQIMMVNKDGYILHKVAHKKGKRHIIYSMYKKDYPIIPKQVVTVVDLGYLGMDKDYPDQLSAYHVKRKETKKNYARKKKKNTTNFTLRRE